MAREIARRGDGDAFEEYPDLIKEPSQNRRRLCPKCRAAAKKASEGQSAVDGAASDAYDNTKT